MVGRRARARLAEAAEAQAEAERAESERAETVRRLREALAAEINDSIVHTIGAAQAVVRGAHPDDVLTRLHAAEDSAREALTRLGQLDEWLPDHQG